MHVKHRLVPGLVVGALTLGGASGVFAARVHHGHARHAVIAGQIANLSATGFTVTFTPKHGKNGAAPVAKSFRVAVSATTREVARKGTTGTLANGDFAAVAGTRAKGTITAARVLFANAPFKLRLHRVIGAVTTGSSATSLVVTTRSDKTRTFAITSSTKFGVGKVVQTSPLTLTTGQKVLVHFRRDKAVKKQLDALVIRVRAAKAAVQP
jgi:hypothetical protein